jgi:hypothetical protein
MMNNDLIIFYILIGIFLAAIVESGYDRRRRGEIGFQFDGPDINWMARIMTIALWPIVIMIFLSMVIRDIANKFNKDKDGH